MKNNIKLWDTIKMYLLLGDLCLVWQRSKINSFSLKNTVPDNVSRGVIVCHKTRKKEKRRQKLRSATKQEFGF